MSTLKLLVGPTLEPLTSADVKLHTKIESSADDTIVTALIAAARQVAEHELDKVLLTQTWERLLDVYPSSGVIGLGRAPVQSVTSVKYIDTAGAQQVLSTDVYGTDLESRDGYGYVYLKPDQSWPDTYDMPNAVRVEFVAGYGDDREDVPASVLQWMRVHVATWYKHRDVSVVGASLAMLPDPVFSSLLWPHKLLRV